MSEPPSKLLADRLTSEEIEAWNMWIYRSHDIMPNQYHHFYDNGDTLIYPEHIRDLVVLDTIWNNKKKMLAQKAQSKAQAKKHPMMKSNNRGGLGGFFGTTFKIDNSGNSNNQ